MLTVSYPQVHVNSFHIFHIMFFPLQSSDLQSLSLLYFSLAISLVVSISEGEEDANIDALRPRHDVRSHKADTTTGMPQPQA